MQIKIKLKEKKDHKHCLTPKDTKQTDLACLSSKNDKNIEKLIDYIMPIQETYCHSSTKRIARGNIKSLKHYLDTTSIINQSSNTVHNTYICWVP